MVALFGQKKGAKDPFSVFINSLEERVKKIRSPEGFQEMMKEAYGEEMTQVLEAASDFLLKALDGRGIKVLSLILDRERKLPAWFKKGDPTNCILNFAFDPRETETQRAIRGVLVGQEVALEKSQPAEISLWEEHFQRGLELARTDNLNAAIEETERAHQLNPKDKLVLHQLALLYLRRGDEQGNFSDIQKAWDLEDEVEFDYELRQKVRKARETRQNIIDFSSREESENGSESESPE